MSGIPGRKTAYAGILMRSRLEADYASHLDRNGDEWKYEPLVFAGPAGQWLPDFWSRTTFMDEPWAWYTEIKPLSHARCGKGENFMACVAGIDELLSRMSMTFLTEPEANLQLVWWEYGAQDAPCVYRNGREGPWVCHGIPSVTLWPGNANDGLVAP